MKKNTIILLIALLALSLLTGCAKSIEDIKQEKYIGETVTVKGEVINSIKIGSLSGYTLEDDSGSEIGVSSEELPKEGMTKTVRGTLMKDTLFGYYIKSDE